MARILLIETATGVCSTAIAVDGTVVAIEEELQAPSHSALLTLQIERCVKESGIDLADLDAVAVSSGPGSYTALRVGASVAKGICYALDKPLIAVDTLLALAHAAREAYPAPIPSTVYIPMLDARRQEVWLAVYDVSMNVLMPAQPLILEDKLFENCMRSAFPDALPGRLVFSGNGSLKLDNVKLDEKMAVQVVKNCSARHFSTIAEQFFQNNDFQDVVYFEPFYMKPPNITTPSKAPF